MSSPALQSSIHFIHWTHSPTPSSPSPYQTLPLCPPFQRSLQITPFPRSLLAPGKNNQSQRKQMKATFIGKDTRVWRFHRKMAIHEDRIATLSAPWSSQWATRESARAAGAFHDWSTLSHPYPTSTRVPFDLQVIDIQESELDWVAGAFSLHNTREKMSRRKKEQLNFARDGRYSGTKSKNWA